MENIVRTWEEIELTDAELEAVYGAQDEPAAVDTVQTITCTLPLTITASTTCTVPFTISCQGA